jgi:hypothetical protein
VLAATAGSNSRVWTEPVKLRCAVGPCAGNGPIVVGSASQVCGATVGSDTVTDGCWPFGPPTRSGSPSKDRSVTWSAGNGETSKLTVWSALADIDSESDWVGTRTAGNGASGAGSST